jgi:hypothetical protein
LAAVARRIDLEGIVAKRMADSYSPETVLVEGQEPDLHPGAGQWELFQKRYCSLFCPTCPNGEVKRLIRGLS